MSWLDLIDEQQARRMARRVGKTARVTGELAREQLKSFARDAGEFADEVLQPQRVADTVASNARATRDLAREHLNAFAHDAGLLASDTAQQIARYGRQEGALVAAAAATQAARAGRAVRADPVPFIVGAIGLVLLTSLMRARRSSR